MRIQKLFLCAAVLAAIGPTTWLRAQEPPAPTPGMEPQAITLAAPQSVVMEGSDAGNFRPWGSIQNTTGPGIGYRSDFTTLEGFIPVYQGNVGILFGDLRGLLGDSELVSANLGGGYRYYSVDENRIWGTNVFWDSRDTGEHTFNQVGFGFESLGRWWDTHSNVYLVTGRDQAETTAFFDNPFFLQHFIMLNRVGIGQAAMSGFDAEVGMPLSCRWGLKAYVGTYNFQVNDSPQAWGIETHIEERVTDNLDMNLEYANDKVFGNTVTFQIGYRFGGRQSRQGAARCDVYARMVDRIERNQEIAVTSQTLVTQQPACDPTLPGMPPIIVEHVASYAAPGGNGTVEHPFQTLLQAENASAPNNYIFAWANSVFTNQSIVLKNNQHFLGEAAMEAGGAPCPLTFTACQGTFLLPRATSFTNAPIITTSTGNTITLANNDEAAGFTIDNTAHNGNGIFGNGITNFYIHCNDINSENRSGILLNNVAGVGTITENTLDDNGRRGLSIDTVNNLNVTVTNNVMDDNGTHGIRLQADHTAVVTANISGNEIDGNGTGQGGDRSGVRVQANDTASINLAFNGNDVSDNGLHGLRLVSTANSVINGTVGSNKFDSNNSDGIHMDIDDSSQQFINIAKNAITNNGASGIHGIGANDSVWNVGVSGNTIAGNDAHGIRFTIDDDSMLTTNITGNKITGNGTNGVFLQSLATATATSKLIAGVVGNTISGNMNDGIDVNATGNNGNSSVFGVTINNNVIGDATNGPNSNFGVEMNSRRSSLLNAQVNSNTFFSDTFSATSRNGSTFGLGLHFNNSNEVAGAYTVTRQGNASTFFLERNPDVTFPPVQSSGLTTLTGTITPVNFGAVNATDPVSP